jgi:hypothetical protein
MKKKHTHRKIETDRVEGEKEKQKRLKVSGRERKRERMCERDINKRKYCIYELEIVIGQRCNL